jgi:hypothetical protein
MWNLSPGLKIDMSEVDALTVGDWDHVTIRLLSGSRKGKKRNWRLG